MNEKLKCVSYPILVFLCVCLLLLAFVNMVKCLEMTDADVHVSDSEFFAVSVFCSTLFFVVIVDQIRGVLWHYSDTCAPPTGSQILAALKLIAVVFFFTAFSAFFVRGIAEWYASSSEEALVRADALSFMVVGCFGIFCATWAACALMEKLQEIRKGTSCRSASSPPVKGIEGN